MGALTRRCRRRLDKQFAAIDATKESESFGVFTLRAPVVLRPVMLSQEWAVLSLPVLSKFKVPRIPRSNSDIRIFYCYFVLKELLHVIAQPFRVSGSLGRIVCDYSGHIALGARVYPH